MTDKQIIIEKGNQKCIFYNDDICRKGDKTRDCLNCARVEYHSLYKLNWENQERLESQLKAKEQECEDLKKSILQECPNCGEEYLNYKGVELYYENNDLKQILTEIEKLAIQGNVYCIDYNVDDCEKCIKQSDCKTTLFKQILQKISEVEDDNA